MPSFRRLVSRLAGWRLPCASNGNKRIDFSHKQVKLVSVKDGGRGGGQCMEYFTLQNTIDLSLLILSSILSAFYEFYRYRYLTVQCDYGAAAAAAAASDEQMQNALSVSDYKTHQHRSSFYHWKSLERRL